MGSDNSIAEQNFYLTEDILNYIVLKWYLYMFAEFRS